MAYSLVGFYHTSNIYQALVNSCAVVTTDIIIFLIIFITKEKGFNPIFNALVVVAIRACMIVFTGIYWFLGYCLLYLILMGYLSGIIMNKYYPPFEKLPVLKTSKTNLFKLP